MADSILSAFMQVVFQQLASPIIEEFGFIHGLQKQLKKLSRMLVRIRAVINDAEQRQTHEEAVGIWLKELKEIAYDADDILDEMSTQVLLERSCSQVKGFFSSFSPNHLRFQFEIASRIDEIIEKLEDIGREKEDLHLKEGALLVRGHKARGRRLQTSSLVDEQSVFGRTNDRESLISLLVCEGSNEKKVPIIPVVGMGGVGKSTLVQLIYNDNEIAKHFELRMWVCVLEEFDPRMITKAIIESATGAKCDLLDMDPMQRHLQQIIKEKKYLLVLDDVWNESYNEWDALCVPFNVGANGSKIIVTTRSEVVSSLVGTIPAYHLKGLSDRDGWSLFMTRAFRHSSSDAPENLVRIGKSIVNKYQGLPLALKALGDLLSAVTDENEWDIASTSEIWELPEEKIDILQTLKLSYHHLPSHLKQCFGYCSIFPRDHVYKKESLILLWMAQGFVQPKGIKQEEDVGSDTFDDLLLRSFFQYSHVDPLDDLPRYKMHGLIHDLSKLVTQDDSVMIKAKKVCFMSRKARHVSILCETPEPIDFEIVSEYRTARSLLFFGGYRYNIKKIPREIFLELKSLRALDLSHTCITELPSSVGNSKHLRFLDLSWTCIKGLPETIGGLCNLQTLNLIKCLELHTLPDNISSLINLRHFNISHSTALLRILPFADRRFLDLPKCIKNPINLRDIDISIGTSFQNILPFAEKHSCLDSLSRMISSPPRMGKLTHLQTFSNFVLTKRTACGVEQLKSLVKLRGSLCISKLENVIHTIEAKEADLKSKHRLQELTLQWSEGSLYSMLNGMVAEQVIEFLQPHKNLRSLRISNYVGLRLPIWLNSVSLSHLVSISLLNCQKCETLPALWRFPSLRDLKIHGFHGLAHIGHDFYGNSSVVGFSSLEKLEMKDMPNLEYWSGVEAGEIPCLREFTVWDCPKMNELPKLKSRLPVLEIANCKGIVSLPTIYSIQNIVLGQCNEMILNSLACFTSLSSLNISCFSELEYLPDNLIQHLASLKELKVVDCDKLTLLTRDRCLWKLNSLEHLDICSCPQLTSLKDEVLPSNLKSLRLVSCPNLTALPEEMENLMTLQFVEAWNCYQLVSLPESKMPINLQLFWLRNCPNLQEHCRHGGENWEKIRHIPNIRIDLEWIQQS